MFGRLLPVLLGMMLAACGLLPGAAMAQYFGRPAYQPQYQQPQAPQRGRNLFDMLFGPRQQQYQAPDQSAPTAAPPVVRKPSPPRLPPPKPTIAKAPGATRIAVFGNSLATDVGGALDRLYADDPNMSVLQQAVGQSGFARPDYFDWTKTIGDQIKANSFDVAVMMIGINDRQTITAGGKSLRSLTDDWNAEYSARLGKFLDALRAANKPIIWIGMPPMAAPQFSNAMNQISSLQRLAVFGSGGEFVDIYEKFLDDDGNYSQRGPDVNGNDASMRRADGVHFTNAGADKVAFYADQSIRLFAHGGGGVAIVDPLAGTDAAAMLRPPYQGLGQASLLQLAGAVVPLTGAQPRAESLVQAGAVKPAAGFDFKDMLQAPVGRADAFGVGVNPAANEAASKPVAAAAPAAVAAPPAAPAPLGAAAPPTALSVK